MKLNISSTITPFDLDPEVEGMSDACYMSGIDSPTNEETEDAEDAEERPRKRQPRKGKRAKRMPRHADL